MVGFLPGKHKSRTSGRSSAGRRSDFSAYPRDIRRKSCPEALCVRKFLTCRHGIGHVGYRLRRVMCFGVFGVSLLTPTWALPAGATARRSVGADVGTPGSFKRTRGPLKGPRGPFKGPWGPFKGPRGLLKGPLGPTRGLMADPYHTSRNAFVQYQSRFAVFGACNLATLQQEFCAC